MVANIDQLIDRNEKIEILVDQTQTLQEQTHKFKKSSDSLWWAILWKNIKLTILIICILLVCN